jgi:hypothetical protein
MLGAGECARRSDGRGLQRLRSRRPRGRSAPARSRARA